MTKLIYPKEASRQTPLSSSDPIFSSDAEQILHLKRLLVTLKQHYEKNLQASQSQLQLEQNQKLALQKEMEFLQKQWIESQKEHEEELQALGNQQACLKELLKKNQEELKQYFEQSPSLKEKQQELTTHLHHHEEDERVRDELKQAKNRIQTLEQELSREQTEIERLQKLVEAQKQHEALETVVSKTSSHHLRQELESIKLTLAQDTKSLETRYIEILNEKIHLENQTKQLQQQLEHQSSNLKSFQAQLHELETEKKRLEEGLEAKEQALASNAQELQHLNQKMQDLEEKVREKDYLQDKYEQLKDEWNELGERLEEAIEVRGQAEHHLTLLEEIASNQEMQLKDLTQQLQTVHEERKNLEQDRDQLKSLLDESETRLKVAQQHLAKKVKEAALLNEKVEEQQLSLSDLGQTLEQQKTHIAQLQASVDIYQRQEKRLQEQLHDALKGTESQVSKWEEKYFRMYDKWQESENKTRELKKFEEKHHQMQSLLANLGNFMGSSFNPASGVLHAIPEPHPRPLPIETIPEEATATPIHKAEPEEERYDLFGMRQPK